jgi:hypothetical protein
MYSHGLWSDRPCSLRSAENTTVLNLPISSTYYYLSCALVTMASLRRNTVMCWIAPSHKTARSLAKGVALTSDSKTLVQ